MATTRMIFTDLTLLQIPGLKSRTQLESLLHLDIELHALLSKKTCTCSVDMMGQNSLMTFTITVSKQANGFKYTLKDNKIRPHETVTSCSVMIIPFFCLEDRQETRNLISLSSDLMREDGRISSVQKVHDLLVDFVM